MSLETVLAELRREYAPVVRTTVTELEQELERGRSGGDPRVAWRIAHRLAGTAGSYGFSDVGHAARAVEDALDAPSRDDAVVASALDNLRRAAAALTI